MMSRARVRGFTLIEVTIVGALISALTLLIVQSLADLARTQAYTAGQWRIAEIADRAMRRLVRDVTYSVRVFTDSEDSDAYLAVVDYPDAEVVAESRLPALTQRGYFDRDPEEEMVTGNFLFLARNEQPVLVSVGSVEASRSYRVDTMIFVAYYLRRDGGDELDLARWGSAQLARHKDIAAIENLGEREQAVRRLIAAGVRYAWDPSVAASEGLFELTELGGVSLLPSNQKIPEDPAQRQSSILSKRRIAMAPNGKVGKLQVPKYANATAGGFPGGFEVNVDGPSTGKLVLLRIVLRSGQEGARENFAEGLRLVSCRDG